MDQSETCTAGKTRANVRWIRTLDWKTDDLICEAACDWLENLGQAKCTRSPAQPSKRRLEAGSSKQTELEVKQRVSITSAIFTITALY